MKGAFTFDSKVKINNLVDPLPPPPDLPKREPLELTRQFAEETAIQGIGRIPKGGKIHAFVWTTLCLVSTGKETHSASDFVH